MNARELELQLSPDAMYAREVTAAGIVKHSRHCQGFFGRRDPRCARCLQLLHGSAPRGSESQKARKPESQRRFLW